MRKSATENLQSNTVVSLSDIRRERERAYSPYGPVRAGLIISQTTELAQLSELLNCLEKKVEILVSKSYEVLDISQFGTPIVLAKHFDFITNTVGIKE